MIFKFYFFIFGHNLSHWRSTLNFYKIKNYLILFLSITNVSLIKTPYIIHFWYLLKLNETIVYKVNENLKNQLNFNFLTSNVQGLQSTKKRLRLFNFLKNKIGPEVLFLQETHSSVEIEKKWIDDFKDKI